MALLTVFNGALSWRERYEAVELAGIRSIAGRQCYEVVLTPGEGHPVTWFLDVETLLLVKFGARVGGTLIETLPSDYREIDGVLVPHEVRRLMEEGGPGPGNRAQEGEPVAS